MKLLSKIETYLNRHLAYWMTNGCYRGRLSEYDPKRKKDYKTRNEQVRWLHDVSRTSWSERQIEASQRLAELFATHHGEEFSPSTGRILDDNYEQLNNPK